MPFTDDFGSYPIAGDYIECTHDGFTVRATIHNDDSGIIPWEEYDGHGIVSEWTTRAKRPGERVLVADRHSRRYYDIQESMTIARRDGWSDGNPVDGEPAGARAAKAVEADFQRLRAWCNNEWCYVGIVLSIYRGDVCLDDHAASLWCIESDAGEYLVSVANELLDEAVERGREVLSTLCKAEA